MENITELPRPYQLELFEQAKNKNVIAYLDTGSGKTLVSVLLIQTFALPLVKVSRSALLAKLAESRYRDSESQNLSSSSSHFKFNTSDLPAQPKKIVFLVPTVPLVSQQASKIRRNTDVEVGEYSRDDNSSVSYWDAVGWYHEISKRQVLVFTPQIFLNVLRHGFMSLDQHISLLIFDECHHTIKNHAYRIIMSEFYHTIEIENRPKIFGMTASPIHQKSMTHIETIEKMKELQYNLDCVVVTVENREDLKGYVPQASELLLEYDYEQPD
ncbi:hypothetical protein HK096_009768, partial [Nowakowskiella sp. JEL0078]